MKEHSRPSREYTSATSEASRPTSRFHPFRTRWRPPKPKTKALPSLTDFWSRGWNTAREYIGAYRNYPLVPSPRPPFIKVEVHQRGPKSILIHWKEFPLIAFSGVQILGGGHGGDGSNGAGTLQIAVHRQPDFPGRQGGPTGSYQKIGPPLVSSDVLLHCEQSLRGCLPVRHRPQDPCGLGGR